MFPFCKQTKFFKLMDFFLKKATREKVYFFFLGKTEWRNKRGLTTMLKTKFRTFSPSSALISAPNWTKVLRNLFNFPKFGLADWLGVDGGEELPVFTLPGERTRVDEGEEVFWRVDDTWLKDGGVVLACPPSGLPGDFIPKTELPSVKFVQISNYFYSPRIALDLVLKLYLAKVSYYVSCNFQYQFFFFFQSENLASRTISQSRINSRKFTAERGGGGKWKKPRNASHFHVVVIFHFHKTSAIALRKGIAVGNSEKV